MQNSQSKKNLKIALLDRFTFLIYILRLLYYKTRIKEFILLSYFLRRVISLNDYKSVRYKGYFSSKIIFLSYFLLTILLTFDRLSI